jgi:hypothetical protein
MSLVKKCLALIGFVKHLAGVLGAELKNPHRLHRLVIAFFVDKNAIKLEKAKAGRPTFAFAASARGFVCTIPLAPFFFSNPFPLHQVL